MGSVMRVAAVLSASFLLITGAASALTIEGRELRLEGGVFATPDAEWLLARARYLLGERDYGRANDLATLLANAAPADIALEAWSFAARTKYYAVGHKESYIAFKKLYDDEKKRREAATPAGGPLSDEDKARLGVVSAEAVATLGTAYGAAAVSGLSRISSYDSPTANTGAAEPQTTRLDLRWSVNLLFLLKEYDPPHLADAKAALKAALDESRTFKAFFRDVSMPKDSQVRAVDDVRGSVGTRARKMLPGALAREMQDTYNMEQFKFCISKPVGATELTTYAARIMKLGDKEEIKVEQYNEGGYVAYRATATARAEATSSLADALRWFGADPYVWRPFVGKLEEKEGEEKAGTPAAGAGEAPAGGIPDAGGIPESE